MSLPLQRVMVALALAVIPAAGCSREPAGLPAELHDPGAIVARHEPPAGSGGDERFVLETSDGEAAVADFYRKGISGWRQANA